MDEQGLSRARIDAVELSYRARGRGSPLLMFHGHGGDHRIYDQLQDVLAGDVASISFDQRDCGSSRWIGPAPLEYGVRDLAGDAVGLMDGLGHRRFHVLGNSLGGLIAQHLAHHWPDRVDRLILGFSWPACSRLNELYPDGVERRRELGALGAAGERLVAELMSSPEYVAQHPEFMRRLAEITTAPSAEALARRRHAVDTAPPVDPRTIQAKTLVVAAERDQMVPPFVAKLLGDAIPNAQFHLLHGVGHLAALEDADQLAATVRRFLDARP